MASNLGARVSRAVLFSGANTIFTRVVTVVVVAIVVRLVTPEEFGTYAVALTAFTVIAGFSELGLASILARKDLDPDEIGPTVSALSLITGTVLAFAMYLGAGPLASAMGAPDADDPLRVLSLSVFMIGLFAVPTGLLTRDFRQGSLLVANLVAAVPDNVLCIVLALQGQGAMAFAWSRVVGHLVVGLMLTYYARKGYWPRIQRQHLRTVAGFGFNFGGANLVRYILLNADYLFVGKLMGPAALGIYMLAFQVGQWATSVLSGMINSVAMPALSHESGDPRRLRASLRHSVVLVSLIAFPIAGFCSVLADPIVRVLYGLQWVAAVPVLTILSIYGALFVLTLLLGNVLVATGASGKLLILQLVWLFALVPAMALGVEYDGLRGAAIAHIAVIVVIVIPAHLVPIRRRVSSVGSLMLRACAMPLLLTAITSALGWSVSQLFSSSWGQLLAGGATASSTYLVLTLPLMRAYLPARIAAPLSSARYYATVGRLLRPVVALNGRISGEAVADTQEGRSLPR